MIVEGQIHGALASGLGQALLENAVYDPDGGQLVTGSFMDYAMPRADDMPPIRDAIHPVPATTNPLGVKGVGEAAHHRRDRDVMNAIANAIPGEAGARLEMPATPEKVWQACQAPRLIRLLDRTSRTVRPDRQPCAAERPLAIRSRFRLRHRRRPDTATRIGAA